MAKTLTGKQLIAQVIKKELERQLRSVLRKMSPLDARVLAYHVTGARNLHARQIVTRAWLEEISAMEQAKFLAKLMTPEGQKRVRELTGLVVQRMQ